MKTEIIKSATKFKPVTIQMTFETEDELAVFTSVMGDVVHTFKKLEPKLMQNAVCIFNTLVPADVWNDLRTMVRYNQFTV